MKPDLIAYLTSVSFDTPTDAISYMKGRGSKANPKIVSDIIDGNFFVYERDSSSVFKEGYGLGFIGADGDFRVTPGTLGDSIDEVCEKFLRKYPNPKDILAHVNDPIWTYGLFEEDLLGDSAANIRITKILAEFEKFKA